MAMWLACAAVATWLAGTQIVLVSTYLTEFYQTKPRKSDSKLRYRISRPKRKYSKKIF